MLTKIILASRDLDQLIFLIIKYEAKNHCLISINQSADCLPDIWAKKRLEDTKTSFFDPKFSENAEIQLFPHRLHWVIALYFSPGLLYNSTQGPLKKSEPNHVIRDFQE